MTTHEFQSTPSGGKATEQRAQMRRTLVFQSTPSGGKATISARGSEDASRCFNPRLPGGRRLRRYLYDKYRREFQSTPSGGKATVGAWSIITKGGRFNPRLPGGRRPTPVCAAGLRCRFNPRLPGGRRPREDDVEATLGIVSIHAFRGEGDPDRPFAFYGGGCVSIHAFRGEGDGEPTRQHRIRRAFQSTPSGGKATAISRAAVPCSRQIL